MHILMSHRKKLNQWRMLIYEPEYSVYCSACSGLQTDWPALINMSCCRAGSSKLQAGHAKDDQVSSTQLCRGVLGDQNALEFLRNSVHDLHKLWRFGQAVFAGRLHSKKEFTAYATSLVTGQHISADIRLLQERTSRLMAFKLTSLPSFTPRCSSATISVMARTRAYISRNVNRPLQEQAERMRACMRAEHTSSGGSRGVPLRLKRCLPL